MDGPFEGSWRELAGQRVRMERDGRTVRTGLVEVASRSSFALWMVNQNGTMRTLFEKSEQYVAWPAPEGSEYKGN